MATFDLLNRGYTIDGKIAEVIKLDGKIAWKRKRLSRISMVDLNAMAVGDQMKIVLYSYVTSATANYSSYENFYWNDMTSYYPDSEPDDIIASYPMYIEKYSDTTYKFLKNNIYAYQATKSDNGVLFGSDGYGATELICTPTQAEDGISFYLEGNNSKYIYNGTYYATTNLVYSPILWSSSTSTTEPYRWYMYAEIDDFNVNYVEALTISGSVIVQNENNSATYSYTAKPYYSNNKDATWSVDGNYVTISNDGILTILEGANNELITLKATSTYDSTIYADYPVTVNYVAGLSDVTNTNFTFTRTSYGGTSDSGYAAISTVTTSSDTDVTGSLVYTYINNNSTWLTNQVMKRTGTAAPQASILLGQETKGTNVARFKLSNAYGKINKIAFSLGNVNYGGKCAFHDERYYMIDVKYSLNGTKFEEVQTKIIDYPSGATTAQTVIFEPSEAIIASGDVWIEYDISLVSGTGCFTSIWTMSINGTETDSMTTQVVETSSTDETEDYVLG